MTTASEVSKTIFVDTFSFGNQEIGRLRRAHYSGTSEDKFERDPRTSHSEVHPGFLLNVAVVIVTRQISFWIVQSILYYQLLNVFLTLINAAY